MARSTGGRRSVASGVLFVVVGLAAVAFVGRLLLTTLGVGSTAGTLTVASCGDGLRNGHGFECAGSFRAGDGSREDAAASVTERHGYPAGEVLPVYYGPGVGYLPAGGANAAVLGAGVLIGVAACVAGVVMVVKVRRSPWR